MTHIMRMTRGQQVIANEILTFVCGTKSAIKKHMTTQQQNAMKAATHAYMMALKNQGVAQMEWLAQARKFEAQARE